MLKIISLESFILDNPTSAHFSSLARLLCMRDIFRLMPNQPIVSAVNPFHFLVDYARHHEFSLMFIRVRYNQEPYYHMKKNMIDHENDLILMDSDYRCDPGLLESLGVFPSLGRVLAKLWGATERGDEHLTPVEKRLYGERLYLENLFSGIEGLHPELVEPIKQMLISLLRNECSQAEYSSYVNVVEEWIYRQMAFDLFEKRDLDLLRRIEMHLKPIQQLLASTNGMLRFRADVGGGTNANADVLLEHIKKFRRLFEEKRVETAPWMVLFVSSMLSIEMPFETPDAALLSLEGEIMSYLEHYQWLKGQTQHLQNIASKYRRFESITYSINEVIEANRDSYKTYFDTGLLLFQSRAMREIAFKGLSEEMLRSSNDESRVLDSLTRELKKEAHSTALLVPMSLMKLK